MGQEAPTAPQTFKLLPVKTEQEPMPPPEPAHVQQQPTLESIERTVLHTVDDHAIQVSSQCLLPGLCSLG